MAYLKVSEGCDRLCTFCAIPYMRGKHVTKPIERVVEEARELAADGVRELNLVAQDMTYYGVDLYGRPRLAELIRELDGVEGIDWIRILYNYPNYFTDELYEVLGSAKKVVPYLDMPLQHISDHMLDLMKRETDGNYIRDLIKRNEFHEIKEIMEKSKNLGMQTFDQALIDLVNDGSIDEEEAVKNADSANNVRLKLKLYRETPSAPAAAAMPAPVAAAPRPAAASASEWGLELKLEEIEIELPPEDPGRKGI
jgi:hypothetical protein